MFIVDVVDKYVNKIGNFQKKLSVKLLTTVEVVIRYVHAQKMLYLSEEISGQMVVSIGRSVKSSKKNCWKNPKQFQ